MKVKWSELTKLEHRLKHLFNKAKSYKDDKTKQSFCANRIWFGNSGSLGLRGDLIRLVGWSSKHPVLGTSEAYDVAYEKIYKALPDCRNCDCM